MLFHSLLIILDIDKLIHCEDLTKKDPNMILPNSAPVHTSWAAESSFDRAVTHRCVRYDAPLLMSKFFEGIASIDLRPINYSNCRTSRYLQPSAAQVTDTDSAWLTHARPIVLNAASLRSEVGLRDKECAQIQQFGSKRFMQLQRLASPRRTSQPAISILIVRGAAVGTVEVLLQIPFSPID